VTAHHPFFKAASIAVLALALAAPAAAASTTVEVERTQEVHFDFVAFAASNACGFPIELHTSGLQITISRYVDGHLVSFTLQWVLSGYLLNPANGKTVTSKVAGPDHVTYLANGTVIDSVTGTTHRNVPGAGLVSGFIGRSYTVLVPTGEVDEDGFPVYDVVEDTFNGQWLGNDGLCGFLA
jgi:hypothetical protein